VFERTSQSSHLPTQFVDNRVSKQTIPYVATFAQGPYFIRQPSFVTFRRYFAVACGAVGQVLYVNAIKEPIVSLNS
jgi:hypothetical protein